MDSLPPSHHSNEPISRAKASSTSIQAQADSMLQVSIDQDNGSVTGSFLPINRSSPMSASLFSLNQVLPSRSAQHLFNASNSIQKDQLDSSWISEASTITTSKPSSQIRSSSDSSVTITSRPLSRTPSFISEKEKEYKMTELSNATRAMQKKVNESQFNKFTFRSACSTDLLFLIDCTHSMNAHIANVKKTVSKIVEDITTAFYKDARILIAVVAYRDHGLRVNIEALDFTENVRSVVAFLSKLITGNGTDDPEDVLGGIHRALALSWSLPNRCIIHIGDAPPHGRDLQHKIDPGDRYPEPGSDPAGRTYKPLLQKMIRLGINYILLPINSSMDKMAFLFASEYLRKSADARFPKDHQYYQALQDLIRETRTKTSTESGQIMCMVAEQGTVYEHLKKLVVKNVLDSASRTAIRTSSKRSAAIPFVSKALATIGEDEFDITQPDWKDPSSFPVMVDMEGFSADIVTQDNQTLYKMMQNEDNIKIGLVNLTIYRQIKPFAKGALRLAFYGRTYNSDTPYVVKCFQTGAKELPHLVEDMKIQILCRAFAFEFSAATGYEDCIDFILTTSLSARDGAPTRYSLERYITGQYVKYNGNSGYVLPEDASNQKINRLAQAFSHFTFEISRGEFLVCDLQGVGKVLTDPTIHTKDPKRFMLTGTNLNVDGFKFFFATHECNEICSALRLKSNKLMVAQNSFSFRDTWPPVVKTARCFNRLCGKIIRPESIKKDQQYPDFLWCETCFPQISKTLLAQTCEGSGPEHIFVESAFFFESQGLGLPASCPQHRGKEEYMLPTDIPKRRSFFAKFCLCKN